MHACLFVCVCVAYGGQNRMFHPLELELQTVLSCRTWLWKLNLASLKKQQALLTAEPFLLAPIVCFWNCHWQLSFENHEIILIPLKIKKSWHLLTEILVKKTGFLEANNQMTKGVDKKLIAIKLQKCRSKPWRERKIRQGSQRGLDSRSESGLCYTAKWESFSLRGLFSWCLPGNDYLLGIRWRWHSDQKGVGLGTVCSCGQCCPDKVILCMKWVGSFLSAAWLSQHSRKEVVTGCRLKVISVL